MAGTSTSRGPWLSPFVVVLFACTVAGFVLRLLAFHQSLYADELFTYADVHGRGVFHQVRVGENSPPLYFLLAWLSSKLGSSPDWIRLPSLLLGTATIPLVGALGARVFTRPAGGLAAAAMALSPFAVFYGSEGRPYATLMFFSALSALLLVEAVTKGGPSRWWAYGVSAAAVLYTHYTGLTVLAVEVAWAFWRCRRAWLAPAITFLLVALVGLAWLPSYTHQHREELVVLARFSSNSVGHFARDLGQLAAGFPSTSLHKVPGVALLIVLLAAVAVAALPWWRRRREVRVPGGEWLMAALALAAPVGIVVYGLIAGHSITAPRNMIASLPAALVVIAAAVTSIERRAVAGGIAVVLLAVLTVGTIKTLGTSYARPPYRNAAADADRHAAAGEPVIEYALFTTKRPLSQQLTIYFQRPHRYSLVPIAQAPRVAGSLAAPKVIAIEACIHGGTCPDPLPGAAAHGYRLTRHQRWSGMIDVALFEYMHR
jgi:4-amino-4-deoxy-L-arabinose transferase-like glycosyltransferase